MKASELREKEIGDLSKTLDKLAHQRFILRMQDGSGQPAKPHELRGLRRDIARVKTIMTEKEQAGQE